MRPRWRLDLLGRFLRVTGGSVGWLIFWCVLFTMATQLRPPFALAWIGAAAVAFLFYPQLGSGRWRRRRAARLRLRPIGRSLGPKLGLAALLIAVAHAVLSVLYGRVVVEAPPDFTYRHAGEPLGALVMPALALIYAPLVEEFTWRGFLQVRLTRLIGPWAASAVAAALFAASHGSRAWLPFYFLMGLVLSCVFLLTRSLWAAVLVHFANNAVAVAGDAVQPAWIAGIPSWVLMAGLLVMAALVLPFSGRFGTGPALLLRYPTPGRWLPRPGGPAGAGPPG